MDRLLSTRWNFPITHELVLPFPTESVHQEKDEACPITRLNFPTLLVPVYLWSAAQPFLVLSRNAPLNKLFVGRSVA